MDAIDEFAIRAAEVCAARLWAFGSAQYPLQNGRLQKHIEAEVTNTAIEFAVHARRILDNQKLPAPLLLNQPRWDWGPRKEGLKKVEKLRDALNYIIHAVSFQVGFESLPRATATIDGGAICALYLHVRTDKREDALIDVFALGACFFSSVLPPLFSPRSA